MSRGYVGIGDVSVSGNERLRPSYYAREAVLSGLGARRFQSMDELGEAVAATVQHLRSRDLFHEVEASLSVPEHVDGSTGQRVADYAAVRVRFEVKEKQILHGIANTFAQPGGVGVGAKLEAGFRSPFGYGEVIRLGGESSQNGRSAYSANMDVPHIGPGLDDLSIVAMRSEDNNTFYQSYIEVTDSLTTRLSARDGQWSLAAIVAARDEVPIIHAMTTNPACDATRAVLEVANASTKISLKGNRRFFDTRDCTVSPSHGGMLEGSIEVAVPPGSVHYARGELIAQHTVSLGPNILGQAGLTCTLSGVVGLLMPYAAFLPTGSAISTQNQKNLNTHLSDRFSVGGPLSLRGFDSSGVGARSYGGRKHLDRTKAPTVGSVTSPALTSFGDSLGGTSKIALSTVFSVPLILPDIAHRLHGVRALCFMNIGSLGSPDYWARRRSNTPLPIFGPLRVSLGAGLSISLMGRARLEVTYGIPVIKAPHDLVRPFQLGIGLTVG